MPNISLVAAALPVRGFQEKTGAHRLVARHFPTNVGMSLFVTIIARLTSRLALAFSLSWDSPLTTVLAVERHIFPFLSLDEFAGTLHAG
jgi:hypothetical protein